MKSRMKFVFVFASALAVVAALALAGCSSPAPSSSSASPSSAVSSSSASSDASQSSASSVAAPGASNVVTIGLDNNAGTGFQWSYALEPEGVLELADSYTDDLAAGEQVTGGELLDNFVFEAKSPGEATVTFTLERPDGETAGEPQVYAFTVNESLELILNPYRSNFDREPTLGA